MWSQLELSFGAIWLTRYPGLLSYILITPRPVAENRFCPVMPYENAWNRLFCFDSRKTTPATCSLFALTCFNYQKPSNADAVCHFMRKPVHIPLVSTLHACTTLKISHLDPSLPRGYFIVDEP